MNRVKLTGGSLSGTYLCEDNRRKFIRKEVSLVENREFGFYRWFSQFKKYQRLGALFPSLFPKVINADVEGTTAYFDLEYIKDAMTVYQLLRTNPSKNDIETMFQEVVAAMDTLHRHKIASFQGGLRLYIDQEVRRALEFCLNEPSFKDFASHPTIVFNGTEVRPLLSRVSEFYKLADAHYMRPEECLTHGNITLENILYIPGSRRVVFIDLYEENYVDTVYNEYSQILQSCNSYYEIYCELPAVIRENSVTIRAERCAGLDAFNDLFSGLLRERLSDDEMIITKLYEISQFTRLLPFKRYVAKDKMIFFYALASYLFELLTRPSQHEKR